MAERYRRFAKSGITTETTVYTAPHDGEDTPGVAESVIIGFLIANTSTESAEVTVKLVGVDEDGAELVGVVLGASPPPDLLPFSGLTSEHLLNQFQVNI